MSSHSPLQEEGAVALCIAACGQGLQGASRIFCAFRSSEDLLTQNVWSGVRDSAFQSS